MPRLSIDDLLAQFSDKPTAKAKNEILRRLRAGDTPNNTDLAAFYGARHDADLIRALGGFFDINAVDRHGHTFLTRYLEEFSPLVVAACMDLGAHVVYPEGFYDGPADAWRYVTQFNNCPLIGAIHDGNIAHVEQMLHGNPPLQYPAEIWLDGQSLPAVLGGPLHYAVDRAELAIAKLLRDAGAQTNIFAEEWSARLQEKVLGTNWLIVTDDLQLVAVADADIPQYTGVAR